MFLGVSAGEDGSNGPLEMDNDQEDAAPEIELMKQPSCHPNEDIFRKKIKGTIDVWWLFDDGGTYIC